MDGPLEAPGLVIDLPMLPTCGGGADGGGRRISESGMPVFIIGRHRLRFSGMSVGRAQYMLKNT
jgi:hypothetical protein